MTREHWANCITHSNSAVAKFVQTYFSEDHRKCLLVAAAGFDPRSQRVPAMLSETLGDRLSALFIREERGQPDPCLVAKANENESALREIVPETRVERIDVFGDDGAAVGGPRIASLLNGIMIDDDITDVVLDLSALSIGIGFPAAKILLAECEAASARAFHLLIVSNPELDDCIVSEPAERAMYVKGFAGTGNSEGALDPARIWIPQLAEGRRSALIGIGASIGECYKIVRSCPFPPAILAVRIL